MEEKSKLASQCIDQQDDLSSLWKESFLAEQTGPDRELERATLSEKVKFLKNRKEKIEVARRLKQSIVSFCIKKRNIQ